MKMPQDIGPVHFVGIGGSGRQSCTRLAAHVGDMSVLQPELTKTYGMSEWHDDIKRALDKASSPASRLAKTARVHRQIVMN